jgi:hypothetical protein
MKIEEGHAYKFELGKTKEGTVILEEILWVYLLWMIIFYLMKKYFK